MSESIAPPTIRVRISHDKTSKGWRCNETTVEITWQQETVYDANLMADFLRSCHEDGLTEANRRNQVEGFPT